MAMGEVSQSTAKHILIPLSLGYLLRYFDEKRRRIYEREREYRNELKKFTTEIFEPIFELSGDLAMNLLSLVDFSGDKAILVTGTELRDPLNDVEKRAEDFMSFLMKYSTKIDMMLPSEINSSTYYMILEGTENIIDKIGEDEFPLEDIEGLITILFSVQSDLQKLLGFSSNVKLQTNVFKDLFFKQAK